MRAISIPQELIDLLRYEAGRLFRRDTGVEWGTEKKAGYRRGKWGDHWFRRGRVVWAVHHGSTPVDMQIDHHNRNRSDDRIENLRLKTHQRNAENRKKYVNNTSGVAGVHWSKCSWQARIGGRTSGNYEYLGRFKRFEDAVAARDAALEKRKYDPTHGKAPAKT